MPIWARCSPEVGWLICWKGRKIILKQQIAFGGLDLNPTSLIKAAIFSQHTARLPYYQNSINLSIHMVRPSACRLHIHTLFASRKLWRHTEAENNCEVCREGKCWSIHVMKTEGGTMGKEQSQQEGTGQGSRKVRQNRKAVLMLALGYWGQGA